MTQKLLLSLLTISTILLWSCAEKKLKTSQSTNTPIERSAQMSSVDWAEALLKKPGRPLEDVKLQLLPETIKKYGADSFYAFMITHPRIMLFVFVFKDEETAIKNRDKVGALAAKQGLVNNIKIAQQDELVLLAGTESTKTPDQHTQETISIYSKAFAQ